MQTAGYNGARTVHKKADTSIDAYNFLYFRFFGLGFGTLGGITLVLILLIYENRINIQDDFQPKIWYPFVILSPIWMIIVLRKFGLPNINSLGQGTIALGLFMISAPVFMINRSQPCQKFVLKGMLKPFRIFRS
jgi:hypothetical protein